ncbi:deazaflavin-dependent oxidoreductase, nitroreductase family [Rubrobacter radiotolerans]|uniref:Deazaflavin-dependent oxidoreductase, nitroreductase family n=1 Tax=Rubrobacter radiotolerans TaxID=42256 RepID=A0A023X5Q1_RUBRA|nr:nitroreductase family deazaflavin-dependent oxidoreductase [Rubrobacter radiotolerans]AHY47394.1 deazaflavin-dependent oxidoreductase, nitroreductase family [Rubrobacter radiotolerans]MDX5894797.1 nitroreductase family deazaflavin-dependent oxidoreductase [Rubrobacter radiotolerans]SMC06783.1 deazaflavin-dependent oxidoreductase, nitroreductase family [Rubrobacter radiotolerans DSM 5868]
MARGRAYNPLIRNVQRFAAKLHVALFKRTNGRLGGRMLGSPVLVLVTRGRRTGALRETPLLYLDVDGDRTGDLAVVASNGGTAGHPAWYLNLMAQGRAEVIAAGERFPVVARLVEGRSRHELWQRLVAMYPSYADYQRKTDRTIPVVLLKRV